MLERVTFERLLPIARTRYGYVQESVNEVVNRLTFFKVGVLDVHHLVDAVAERQRFETVG